VDSSKIKVIKPNWAIIGAGIGGIATAIRLKALGFEPVIFESNAYPGGKLSELNFSGFRFDAGPSLFTMPFWLEDLFKIQKKNFSEYFSYISLEESARYFFEDGTLIHGFTQAPLFAREIEKNTQDSSKQVLAFLDYSKKIYQITNPVFLQKSLHRISTYFNTSIIPSILGLPYIDSGRNMNQANSRFFKDPKTIQIFNRYATYNGSNPFKAPATLNVIPHLENHYGAYFPKQGMISIIRSMEKLAMESGIPIHYNTPVDEIIISENRVKGIRLGDKMLPFQGVVSNMDVFPTYKKLLPGKKYPKRTLERERSSSALIFYWGMDRVFPELDLHNIFFTENYRKEFEAIARGSIDADPTIYINISSKYKPDDAPPGMENWFTMINVPSNTDQDWDYWIKEARNSILLKLNRILGIPIQDHILDERILDPRGIEQKTSSYQGSLYGTSSNHPFSAFFRHPNFSRKYKGLYFCGGSVHPGGGIPLALLSAKITSELIYSRELKG
jgi:phytoene desaturase